MNIPDDLCDMLSKNPSARKIFYDLLPSKKKQYIDWINDAVNPQIRKKRLIRAIELILGLD